MMKYNNDLTAASKSQKKCCIYVRISTINKQDTERQLNDLNRLAKNDGFIVVKEFEDKITGTSKAIERTGFSLMDEYIKSNNIKHVLVWELSRIGRNMSDIVTTVENFNERGINIHFCQGIRSTLNVDGTVDPYTIIMIGILSGFAHMERLVFKERSISGLRNSALSGRAGGGIVRAYGFAKDENKILVIEEEEAVIIKEIFNLYLEGMGTYKITNYLNDRKVPTRYNKAFDKKIKNKKGISKHAKNIKWADATVYGILTNSLYMGKRKFKDEVFNAPVIIDEETFNKVQELLKSNYNKKDINRQYPNIFKDKIMCGNPTCRHSYYMHKRATKKDNAYKCLSKRYRGNCGNPSIGIDKLNNAVYQFLSNGSFLDIAFKNISNEKVMKLEKDIEVLQAGINQLDITLSDIKRKKSNLIKIQSELESFDVEEIKIQYQELDDLQNQIIKKHSKSAKEMAVQQDLVTRLNNFQKIDFSNVDVYKAFIQDYLEHIKIFEFTDLENIQEPYTNKQDVLVLVEVKIINGLYNYIIVSQRTSFMLTINFNHINIDKQQFSLKDFEYQRQEIGNAINIDT